MNLLPTDENLRKVTGTEGCYKPSVSSSSSASTSPEPGLSWSWFVGATLPDACPFIIRQQNLQKTQRTMTMAIMTPKPIASPTYSLVLSAGGDDLPPGTSGDCVPGSCRQFKHQFHFRF